MKNQVLKTKVKIMKTSKIIIALLLFMGIFSACKKDKLIEAKLPEPTIENIEIGLNNSEIGIIGRDFHFDSKILAGDKIEDVQIKILPKVTETYSKPWKLEITYNEYKGAKNATTHKHFNIPADAVEGKYDFLIIVNDQNGTQLQVKKNITIYDAKNLPVDPLESIFSITNNGNSFYRKGKFASAGAKIKKGDVFYTQVTLDNIKGSGKMYILLINKKLGHRPESIDKIDFSKVIVYDFYEHKDWTVGNPFSNYVSAIRNPPNFAVGAEKDNNSPFQNSINGVKAWEAGDYYLGYIYLNTTYNISTFKYVEFGIEY